MHLEPLPKVKAEPWQEVHFRGMLDSVLRVNATRTEALLLRPGSAYIIQMTEIIMIVREYMTDVSGAKQWVLRRMVTCIDDAKRK